MKMIIATEIKEGMYQLEDGKVLSVADLKKLHALMPDYQLTVFKDYSKTKQQNKK